VRKIMKRIQLTKSEREIEQNIDEFVPVSQREMAEIAQAIADRKKDAVLNIRISRKDLEHIKERSHKLGVRYQSFISEVLHRVAHS